MRAKGLDEVPVAECRRWLGGQSVVEICDERLWGTHSDSYLESRSRVAHFTFQRWLDLQPRRHGLLQAGAPQREVVGFARLASRHYEELRLDAVRTKRAAWAASRPSPPEGASERWRDHFCV